MFFKRKRIRDRKHLKFVASLPCVGCGGSPCEAHHIRLGTDGGSGLKPSDCFTLSLCRSCHAELHQYGERTFWERHGGPERAIELAAWLYAVSGNEYEALKLIREFNNG